jgi:sulfur transfer complex TusBCD TusB component (DsrH family)
MNRWREYESTLANEDNIVMWSQVIKIARALSRDVLNESGKDIFDGTFYLMHNDLAPRNIMAKVSTKRTVKITGIVDWDGACFVSYCVAMKAPSWA